MECNKGRSRSRAQRQHDQRSADIRAALKGQGSIFQTTSDTEVIVHLIARSKEETLPAAMADSLRRLEGAFSLVMLTPDRVFAARDPAAFVRW